LESAGLLTSAALLLVAAWASPRAIPYNMDEFVHYHALGCATAAHAQTLPRIRDGCGYFDLRLPFTTTPLPLRSYYFGVSGPALPVLEALRRPWRQARGRCCFLICTLLAGRLRTWSGLIVTASLCSPSGS
jgi:hypothetical protein